jgi:Zn-dependent oligopeptidase
MLSRHVILGCIGLLLSSSVPLASSACTNDDTGETLLSVSRLPTRFEATALEVNETLAAAIEVAEVSLSDILALEQNVSAVVLQAQLQQISDVPPLLTYENTLSAINRMMYELWQPGYRLNLLSKTSDIVEVRDAATEAVVQMSKWSRDHVEYNVILYNIIAAFAQTDEAASLTGEKFRYLNETMNDYKRKGMALSEAERAELVAMEERLDVLTTEIDTAITNDVGAVAFTLDDLAGLPETKLAALDYNATTDLYTAATAIASQYSAVSTYANKSDTRLRILRTDNQRAMQENGEPILE